MKFITYLSQTQGPRLGLVHNDEVIDLNTAEPRVPADLRAALQAGADLTAAATTALRSHAPRRPLADLELAPTIPEPGKIICLGLNYADHAREGGRSRPEYPWFFLRAKSSLIGHGTATRVPRISHQLDYEAELAVVIGRRVPRHLPRERTLAHVFGYTCFNDLSVRDYQKRTPQWTIGKNFDATGSMGPILVTADELPPGAVGLSLCSRLNGRVMQDANTNDMLWGVAETLALLSECMTLEPGDVIAMGTPAGVGQARTPPVWLRAGDTIEVQIERIGTLINPVLDETAE